MTAWKNFCDDTEMFWRIFMQALCQVVVL